MNDRVKEMIGELGLLPDQDLYEISEAVVRECADMACNLSPHGVYTKHAILEHFGFE